VSTTDADIVLARMINRLSTYMRGGSTKYDYGLHKYIRIEGKRVWTDREIMRAFGLTQKRFNELEALYKEQSPRYFTPVEWKERYFKFWDENERWHTSKDEKNWRETGLLSRGTNLRWNARAAWVEEFCNKRKGLLRKNPEMVFSIPNLTTRRNVIDSLGADKLVQTLVKQGKAKQLQQDDFGILWRLNYKDGRDNFMIYVEVVNTTPNEKGVNDHYFLRVPPETKTAKDGVAWTFAKTDAKDFKFAAQS
jgi:hypothetical protein